MSKHPYPANAMEDFEATEFYRQRSEHYEDWVGTLVGVIAGIAAAAVWVLVWEVLRR